MRSIFSILSFALVAYGVLAQTGSGPGSRKHSTTVDSIPLHESSRRNLASEIGGAFTNPVKCDADGNLYIRKYATDRPLLDPVVKIDGEGKRVASFDPVAFSELHLDRAHAFTPAADGGLYQIASSGIDEPKVYLLHFSADGSPASPIHLEAEFDPYSFAVFANGNLLVSGFQRDVVKPSGQARSFTALFSADGRMLAQLSFETEETTRPGGKPAASAAPHSAQPPVPTLDLADAEAGADGNVYALRRSSPALIYVISPAGKILRTLKVQAAAAGVMPSAFHVSANRVAVSFWDEEKHSQAIVVSDAQTGGRIAIYSDSGDLGAMFACYSADEGVFTFLNLGEGNALEVIRAEAGNL